MNKIIRCFLVGFMFISLFSITGTDMRQAQEIFFLLAGMILFGLILDNVWVTLFLWLTIFVFSFYKFQIGYNYLQNVFAGCVIYYLVKKSFKKEHIDFAVNGVLWLCFLNIAYMIVQTLGYDWIYTFQANIPGKARLNPYEMCAFMGFAPMVGVFMALCIPLLATRSKIGLIGAVLMAVPLYYTKSTAAIIAGVVSLLLVIWYQYRRFFWVWVVTLIAAGSWYIIVKDAPMGMLPNRFYQWRIVLHDSIQHPVTGWGLDSFRQKTEWKEQVYIMNPKYNDQGKMVHCDLWDNPHNLVVSLMFEWGLFAVLLLGGYLRQIGIWFYRAVKEPNTLALMGFLIAFLLTSLGQFPIFLARTACFIIVMLGVLEVQLRT